MAHAPRLRFFCVRRLPALAALALVALPAVGCTGGDPALVATLGETDRESLPMTEGAVAEARPAISTLILAAVAAPLPVPRVPSALAAAP